MVSYVVSAKPGDVDRKTMKEERIFDVFSREGHELFDFDVNFGKFSSNFLRFHLLTLSWFVLNLF